eukprot:850779-Prymnesium_polylepis.1
MSHERRCSSSRRSAVAAAEALAAMVADRAIAALVGNRHIAQKADEADSMPPRSTARSPSS